MGPDGLLYVPMSTPVDTWPAPTPAQMAELRRLLPPVRHTKAEAA